MNCPSSGNSTLQGPQVTPQKCTSVGRPLCERSISCQLPRTNGLSSDDVSAAGAAASEAKQEYCSQQAFHDPSPIGSRRYPSALVIQER